jgi:5-methyltetrahydrofolate--homocysteine methyltransferase
MSRLLEALHSGRVLLMDGAMGTELQRLGLPEGEPCELWNLTHPEQVCAVHCAYLEAGAEVLLTNTFQANPVALARHGLQDRMGEIWNTALANARMFRDPTPIVLADIGPFDGSFSRDYKPLVDFCRTADGLLLETWTAVQVQGPGCWISVANRPDWGGPQQPLLFSFTYRRDGEPFNMGASAKTCASIAAATIRAHGSGAGALGANCGAEIDMDDLLEVVRRYREVTNLPLFVRPNAGTPRRTTAGWEYPRSPEEMADKLWPLLEAGVTMVGGCCGTTPAHIAAFRRVVDEWNARAPNAKPPAGGGRLS